MDISTARASIGKLVYSRDPGDKLIPYVFEPHGPYELLKITKKGLAILKGREDYRVSPSLLEL